LDKINLKQKRILVTGGNGYLGNKLIERLIFEKAIVYSIDIQENSKSKDATYYKVDIRNKEELTKIIGEINPEIIFHLAASLNRERDFSNVESVFEINLFGTINLLQALKNINYEKFIFTSTSEVYGGDKIKSPFKEYDNFVPASPYSLSKYSAEMAISSFSELNAKKFIILRLFNFYGEGMSTEFFLPQLILKLKSGESFDMTLGEQVRDFIYVNDVIEALLLSIRVDVNNQIFNVSSGIGKTIKEIAIELKKQLKSNSRINLGSLPYRGNEVWEMIGDNSKFTKIFGFTPKYFLHHLK